jgi:hypothetical protein
MPLVRMATSVAGADFAYQAGEEVAMSPEAAQRAVAAGWGELVRGETPQTPEVAAAPPETATRARPAPNPPTGARPPRRVQRRGGG